MKRKIALLLSIVMLIGSVATVACEAVNFKVEFIVDGEVYHTSEAETAEAITAFKRWEIFPAVLR